jgi:hypothetical protein
MLWSTTESRSAGIGAFVAHRSNYPLSRDICAAAPTEAVAQHLGYLPMEISAFALGQPPPSDL